MDSLTAESAESHAETLAKVLPLLEEGRHEEALPFFELHKSKSDDPIWSYLMSLSLACLARGSDGLPLLEQAALSPGFANAFGLTPENNNLLRTTALNHLMFETSVEANALEPWIVLQRYAEVLNHREFQAKSVVGRMKLDPENSEVIDQFLSMFEDAPPDKVIPILDEIVNSRPNACQPRALLGSFLQARGKTALAIRHLKTALESDPKAMEPNLYLGKIYLAQARFDDAEKELSEAMAKGKKPTVALLVEVANCQRATYRYDEALQTLFEAFEIHPPSFRHWDQLVDTAQSTGNTPKLVEALRQAADRFPQDARLRQRFAMVAFRQGEPLAARDQLKATGIFENPTKDPALARLASEVAAALGEPSTALHLLEALWKSSPNSPETSRLCGEALIADGRPAEAETLLRETAKNNPNDRALQVSWGRALLAVGDAERAHRAFSLASRLDPDDAEAMAEQGRAMLLLGLHDEAQNVLKESAKKVDPPLAVTLTGLGAVYERKNLRDIARDFYRQALTRQPDRADAAAGLVRTRAEDGSTTLALDAMELCSSLPTPFARLRLWLNLLRAAFQEGEPGEARALKEKVYPEILKPLAENYRAFLENSEVRTLSKLATDLEANGEPEKARELWRYAVSSPLSELSQKASAELKRLDAYVPASPVAAAPQAEPEVAAPVAASAGEDDPLASLLGATLPEDEDGLFAPATPRPSAASPESDLFADDSTSSAAEEEAPLFAESGESAPSTSEDDIIDALFAVDAPQARTESPAESPLSDLEADLFASEEPSQDASAAAESSFEDPAGDLFGDIEEPAPIATPEVQPASESIPSSESINDALAGLQDQPPSEEPGEPSFDLPLPAPAEAEVVVVETPPAEAVETGVETLVALDESTGGDLGIDLVADPDLQDAPLEGQADEAVEQQETVLVAEVIPSAPEDAAEDDMFDLPLPTSHDDEQASQSESVPVEEAVQVEQAGEAFATEPTEVVPAEADYPLLDESTPAAQDQPDLTEAEVEVESPSAPELAVAVATPSEAPHAETSPTEASPAVADASSLDPRPDHDVREELLPIPMAADFSPLTRRQLHYHEALASSSAGVVSPESLAHLLLQSAVGHEPPDPTSEGGTPSVALLQGALLHSAGVLEQGEQFRGAARVLRTALLYQPDSALVLEAMARVQSRWSNWLAERNEYAHAVSLLRDCLQRQPELPEVAALLESHYQRWMAWSEASGDPAARDLLAVYLEQERAALEGLRAEWQARQARAAAAAAAVAPAQAPPPVAASMPATAPPTPTAPPAPTPVVAAPVAAPPAPAPEAPPETPSPVVAPPTPAVAEPAAPPEAVEAAPAIPEPIAAVPASGAPMFESKEEALETLDTAPDDDSVAEGVFAMYADSMRDLTTALKERSTSAPDQPAWLLLLARAFRRSGSETMAVIQYQKYIKVAPSPEAYEELAQTYEELGKEDFAKMTRRKAERA